MNNIKFRAWLKQRKTMVKVLNLKLETKVVVIWLETSVEGINYGESVSCKFDDVILMQSTGIKDLNGKEVYEGDIVWITSSLENNYSYLIGTVEKVKGCWTVVGENGASVPLYSDNTEISIRGNKYKKPSKEQ